VWWRQENGRLREKTRVVAQAPRTRVCRGECRPGKEGRTRGEKMRGVGAHRPRHPQSIPLGSATRFDLCMALPKQRFSSGVGRSEEGA
jgi:hypothetical protein